MFVLFLCTIFRLEARAADVYEITQTEEGLTGTCNDTAMKNRYVSVKISGDTYEVVKPCTSSSSVYYFNKKGVGVPYTGSKFIKIKYGGSSKVYYSKKGILQKNQIVGSKKQGDYLT